MPRKPRRVQRRLKGKGDYSEEIMKIPVQSNRLEAKIDHLERSLNKTTPTIKGAAATIGRTLGNFVNQGDLGALAGSQLAKFFGHGDYQVKSNSLVSALQPGTAGPQPPKFSNSGKRGTRIIEREFITDITSGTLSGGSSLFTNTNYPINVTDVDTFPWLSTIAQQYDQWEPHGIVFEFVSTSSSYNGSSQALGTVIMATDYDVTDPVFASKQIMENADYSCSTRPSENLVHGIECDPEERLTKIFYTGSNQVSLSKLGNFQLATVGCSAANTKLGELWISYDITFYKKQLVNPISFRPYMNLRTTAASGVGYFATVTSNDSLGIFLTQNVGVGSVINFPPSQGEGYYFFTCWASSTVVNNSYTGTNCIVSGVISGGTNPYVSYWSVTITAPGAFITTGVTGATRTSTLVVLGAPTSFT